MSLGWTLRGNMRKTFFNIVAAITVLGTLTAPVPAWADGGCIPGNIAGQVPRLTRPSDNVCVPPNIAAEVQQENAAAAGGQGYVPTGGAYGPKTCVSGLVWREGYDGDAVCVSPVAVRAVVVPAGAWRVHLAVAMRPDRVVRVGSSR